MTTPASGYLALNSALSATEPLVTKTISRDLAQPAHSAMPRSSDCWKRKMAQNKVIEPEAKNGAARRKHRSRTCWMPECCQRLIEPFAYSALRAL